jgi:hypothetical protein
MKLSQGDKMWLSEEIAKAVDNVHHEVSALKPQGWKKLFFLLREWGLLATNITVIVTLLGLFATAVYAVSSRREADATLHQKTTDRLDDIDKKLVEMNAKIGNGQLATLSSLPTTPTTIKRLMAIVDAAQQSNIPLDRNLVVEAGQHFVEASYNNEDAWGAANNLLSYQTSVVINLAPKLPVSTRNIVTRYKAPVGFTGTTQWMGVSASPAVPELHPVGTANENSKLAEGPAFLLLTGSTVNLDGMVLKRIVIRDAMITYSGGYLSLDQVYFVNCVFKMQPKKSAFLLAKAAFNTSGVVDFQSEG